MPNGRSVASKVVALFDAFEAGDAELSLNELARRTGLPLSTAYRLATELVGWGGLEHDAHGGGYRVGLRLIEVGARAPRGRGLAETVLPFMQDLYAATGQGVHLAVRQGHQALDVERVTGPRPAPAGASPLPLHATGAGKVLLAYAPAELVDDVVAAGLVRYTPYTIVAPGHLRRNLAEIRRSGIGYAHEEMTAGRVSIATAVFDAVGCAAAALSVVVPTSADPQRLAPALRTAALCASRRLREYGFQA